MKTCSFVNAYIPGAETGLDNEDKILYARSLHNVMLNIRDICNTKAYLFVNRVANQAKFVRLARNFGGEQLKKVDRVGKES